MKDIIERLYYVENKSQRQIAKILGLNQTRIKRLMNKYGIQARSLSDSQKNNDLNPWKNKTDSHKKNISKKLMGNKNCLGRIVSQETRDKISKAQTITGESKNGKEYRKLAKENLKQICVKCKITYGLCVHHKDGDHFNNTLSNLEMRCRSCHMKWHRKYQSEKYLK
jgi:hypothetical protein